MKFTVKPNKLGRFAGIKDALAAAFFAVIIVGMVLYGNLGAVQQLVFVAIGLVLVITSAVMAADELKNSIEVDGEQIVIKRLRRTESINVNEIEWFSETNRKRRTSLRFKFRNEQIILEADETENYKELLEYLRQYCEELKPALSKEEDGKLK